MSGAGGAGDGVVLLGGIRRGFSEGAGEREVLRGVDLCVGAGEWVVLLGRSGCGKSTLLNIVGGIDFPDRGRVTVAGHQMERLGERARTLVRRRALGFVFQFFNLVSTLTVQENLMLPLELNGWDRRGAIRRVAQMLDTVGLGERASSFPDTLSGGEQQRVALARAVVHRPALVLADEPTGNLDEETGERVLDLLESLMREQGTTLLMATHSRDVAARADRVLTLREGRLAGAAGPARG
ncbi:MAG TPA: ABC transporter ATP-binding protein [Gammaproteobacteria bacterium]|nr:ABC transporter ATP-binding protein [Gammaproteobacteria bacterium]